MRKRTLKCLGFGMSPLVVGYALVAACVGDEQGVKPQTDGGGNDTSTLDVGVGADGGGDAAQEAEAGPRCDPNKPFANKRLLDNINSVGFETQSAYLTPDEKTAYFSRNSDGGAGTWDIFV